MINFGKQVLSSFLYLKMFYNFHIETFVLDFI